VLTAYREAKSVLDATLSSTTHSTQGTHWPPYLPKCTPTSKADLADVAHWFPLTKRVRQHTALESFCTVLCTYSKCKQHTHGPCTQAGLLALACLGSSASTSYACQTLNAVILTGLDTHWTRDLHFIVPLSQHSTEADAPFLSYPSQHSWGRFRWLRLGTQRSRPYHTTSFQQKMREALCVWRCAAAKSKASSIPRCSE
jgi:hypothetical protein